MVIRYNHLVTTTLSDILFASSRAGKSVRNSTCAKVFETDLGWIMLNPPDFERYNHLVFNKLFKWVLVTIDMIMDGAKSQIEW